MLGICHSVLITSTKQNWKTNKCTGPQDKSWRDRKTELLEQTPSHRNMCRNSAGWGNLSVTEWLQAQGGQVKVENLGGPSARGPPRFGKIYQRSKELLLLYPETLPGPPREHWRKVPLPFRWGRGKKEPFKNTPEHSVLLTKACLPEKLWPEPNWRSEGKSPTPARSRDPVPPHGVDRAQKYLGSSVQGHRLTKTPRLTLGLWKAFPPPHLTLCYQIPSYALPATYFMSTFPRKRKDLFKGKTNTEETEQEPEPGSVWQECWNYQNRKFLWF